MSRVKTSITARAAAAALATFALGALARPQAQEAAARVGFVVSTTLMKAYPGGQQVADLTASAQKELKPLQDQINALRAKATAGTATTAERQRLETLTKTYQSTAKGWQDRLQKSLGPATDAIDAAIRTTAKGQGFSIVLDGVVAQQSGLVIYADESVNLTADVEKLVAKK